MATRTERLKTTKERREGIKIKRKIHMRHSSKSKKYMWELYTI